MINNGSPCLFVCLGWCYWYFDCFDCLVCNQHALKSASKSIPTLKSQEAKEHVSIDVFSSTSRCTTRLEIAFRTDHTSTTSIPSSELGDSDCALIESGCSICVAMQLLHTMRATQATRFCESSQNAAGDIDKRKQRCRCCCCCCYSYCTNGHGSSSGRCIDVCSCFGGTNWYVYC
jgi:hypothetical protein